MSHRHAATSTIKPGFQMNTAEFNKAMGAAIRRHRLAHGLTMKTVADQLGFSYQQQQKNEYGTNGCSAYLLARYASLFGVAVASLYEEAGVNETVQAPTEAESDSFLAARYVGRIQSAKLRSSLIDFTRKLAYEGATV